MIRSLAVAWVSGLPTLAASRRIAPWSRRGYMSLSMRGVPIGAITLVAVFFALSAHAVTTEPNGMQVPRDSMNGETQLYTLFKNRGDPVDWQADAHTAPATFSPLCNFKATFVLHQAGANRGVGWYNVVPNASTPPTQIQVIVPAGTPVGTVITSATIKGDPAYAGGLIGFALVDGQTHYSEQKWNVPCTNGFTCPVSGPWILAVIYQSKSTANAYYLAFEDGSVDALNFGNDGDFNDDVFFFEGLTCQGGGTPCSTGQPGICGAGLNECTGTGLVCQPAVRPGIEKCNGVDDDCNGQTDEGDLCPARFVCDRGTCVGRCGGGEFRCARGKVCNTAGYCVDAACEVLSCPEGAVCVGGACVAPCDGIRCPLPSVCRAGACVDPCAGAECADGSKCDQGVCAPGCGCNPCPDTKACDVASQLCVEPPCAGIVCGANTRCVGGTCVDPCAGAACPLGQACMFGACLDAAVPDSGVGGAGGGSALIFGSDTGGTRGPPGGTPGAGGLTGTGGTPPSGGAAPPALSCGCRTAGSSAGGAPWSVLVAFLALHVRRRRRPAVD